MNISYTMMTQKEKLYLIIMPMMQQPCCFFTFTSPESKTIGTTYEIQLYKKQLNVGWGKTKWPHWSQKSTPIRHLLRRRISKLFSLKCPKNLRQCCYNTENNLVQVVWEQTTVLLTLFYIGCFHTCKCFILGLISFY